MISNFKIITSIFSASDLDSNNQPNWRLKYGDHILKKPVVEKIRVQSSKKIIDLFECELSMEIDSSNTEDQNFYEFKVEEAVENGFHLLFTVYDTTTVLLKEGKVENGHKADANYLKFFFLSIFVEKCGMKVVVENGSVNLSIFLNSFTRDQLLTLSCILDQLMEEENKRLYLSIPMYFGAAVDYWYWDNMSYEINAGNEDGEITEYTYQRGSGIGMEPKNMNYTQNSLKLIKSGMKDGVIPTQKIVSFVNSPNEEVPPIHTESYDDVEPTHTESYDIVPPIHIESDNVESIPTENDNVPTKDIECDEVPPIQTESDDVPPIPTENDDVEPIPNENDDVEPIPTENDNEELINTESDDVEPIPSESVDTSTFNIEMIPFWKTVAGVSLLINLSIFSVLYMLFIYKFCVMYFRRKRRKG